MSRENLPEHVNKPSLLKRFQSFWSHLFRTKSTDPFELNDFVCGLSPETRLKLRRVQGRLKPEWIAARSTPIVGRITRWTQSPSRLKLTRPKIRVQLRRLEAGQPPQSRPETEVLGLDDIFPKRITSFFEEGKAGKGTPGVSIRYQVVGHSDSAEKPMEKASSVRENTSSPLRFDESWRKKVRWPVGSDLSSTNTSEDSLLETTPPEKSLADASWPALFWSVMSDKLSQAITQVTPILDALEDSRVEELEKPGKTGRKILQTRQGIPTRMQRVIPEVSALLVEINTQEDNQPTAFESPAECPPSTTDFMQAPTPRLDASLLISKRRKPFSQTPKEGAARQIENREKDDSIRDENPIDYMWRNNKILAKSISNLADQYFQQAAREESASY